MRSCAEPIAVLADQSRPAAWLQGIARVGETLLKSQRGVPTTGQCRHDPIPSARASAPPALARPGSAGRFFRLGFARKQAIQPRRKPLQNFEFRCQ